MTREEFIRRYAENSGIDAGPWAKLGILEYPLGHMRIALPCTCREKGCLGWAMMTAEFVDHHLTFNAPDELKRAYLKAIAEKEESSNG